MRQPIISPSMHGLGLRGSFLEQSSMSQNLAMWGAHENAKNNILLKCYQIPHLSEKRDFRASSVSPPYWVACPFRRSPSRRSRKTSRVIRFSFWLSALWSAVCSSAVHLPRMRTLVTGGSSSPSIPSGFGPVWPPCQSSLSVLTKLRVS